jgi:hypothetical protein
MIKRLAVLTVLSAATGMLMAQAPGADSGQKTAQVCQLISANPPGFNPYKFIPKVVDFTRLNRYPKVAKGRCRSGQEYPGVEIQAGARLQV